MSTVGGIRDLLIGLGFIFGLEQIQQTRIYQNYEELVPGHSGLAMGILFLVVGLFVAVTAILDKTKWTKIGLDFQAFAWLFSSLMYLMNGEVLLAVIFGVFFSIPAGYLAFYYKYAPLWAEKKRKFRRQWRIENGESTGQADSQVGQSDFEAGDD